MSVFEPVSKFAASINTLFGIVLTIAAVVFLIVVGMLTFFAIRYRGRPGEPDPEPTFGNRKVEVIWIVVPLFIVFSLVGMALATAQAADPAPAPGQKPDLVVIGHQWWWEVRYPGSGVVTANEIHIPVGKSLLVQLQSVDVIHNFWVPQISRKLDATPGDPTQMYVAADAPGTYLGACGEYCGTQHAWMRIRVIAQSQTDYDAWLSGQQKAITVPSGGQAAQGQALFTSRTCSSCHSVQSTSPSPNVGPNLAHLSTRTTIGAGVLDNTPQNLAAWIKDPQAYKPGALMPRFNLSDQDIQSLVAYLNGR